MAEYASGNRSLLLAGRSGSGKSSTGNSIIEDDVFDTMRSSDFVNTSYCALDDDYDHFLYVIDTPGSFDISAEPEDIGLETGIHAVLFVLSLRTRFLEDDWLAMERLIRLFGAKLGDYMIVVFTHGDALDDVSLDDFLGPNCPHQLAKILGMCGNRFAIFDNMTEDNFEIYRQREELLRLVDEVVANNGSIPYTYELYVEPKEDQCETNDKHTGAVSEDEHTEVESENEHTEVESENGSELDKAYYEDQLLEMESKHREMTLRLEKRLAEEHLARRQAEDKTEEVQKKSNDEISKMREDLKRVASKLRKAHRDIENQKKNNHAISLIALATDQIESKLREATLRLENQLVDKFARMLAEDKAQEAQRKANDEIKKLREDMERAQRYTEDTIEQLRMSEENQKKNNCYISEITSVIENQVDSKLGERIQELKKILGDEQVAKTEEVGKKPSKSASEGINGNVNKFLPVSCGFGNGISSTTPEANPFGPFVNSRFNLQSHQMFPPAFPMFARTQPGVASGWDGFAAAADAIPGNSRTSFPSEVAAPGGWIGYGNGNEGGRKYTSTD